MFLNEGKGYQVPKGDNNNSPSAILAGGIWVGAQRNSDFKVAASQFAVSDWYPGPLDAAGMTSQATCSNWDRHFEVLGSDITAAIDLYNLEKLNLTTISASLLEWPAKGNPHFKDIFNFELPKDEDMAPFVDRNFDGIYNPLDGDHPALGIHGCGPWLYADQMIFWVYNDNGNMHINSGGDPMRVEVRQLSYAFKSDDAVNDMTFHKISIINKGSSNMDSTYLGFWIDPSLGCPSDDLIGCVPDRQFVYVMNESDVDGNGDCICDQDPSLSSYCFEVPLLAVDFLRTPLSPSDFEFDVVLPIDSILLDTINTNWVNCQPVSDSTMICTIVTDPSIKMSSFNFMAEGDVNPIQRKPIVDSEFYSYLSGSWRVNTPMTYGGNGYNPGSDDVVKFVFPDPPNQEYGWSLCTDTTDFINGITSLQWLQSSGPCDMAPNTQRDITIGIYFAPDLPDYPCPSLEPMLKLDSIAANFLDLRCFDTSNTNQIETFNIDLYPNPTSDNINFNVEELMDEFYFLDLFDIRGSLIKSEKYAPYDLQVVNAETLKRGTYILRIRSKNKIWVNKVIIL